MGCIFVVDDEVNIRNIITKVLKKDGYEVYDFSNMIDALDALEEYRPSAAILDLNMPGVDGTSFMPYFVAVNCTVVIYSGSLTDESHVELLQRGAMWVVCKPVSPFVIVEYVKKADKVSSSLKVMRKLEPASKDLRERLQKSTDALSEFTRRLRGEPAQTA